MKIHHIFSLPAIVKNQLSMIVDPVLFMQLYFVGQDKKDTSNIAHHGFYNKQDYIEMLYAYAGLGGEQLSQERIDEIKHRISELSDEKKVLLQQHKILKSKKAPVSYLSAESDRLAFGEKVANLEKVVNFHSKCKILGGVAEFFSKAFLCRFPPENFPRPVVYPVHSLPV